MGLGLWVKHKDRGEGWAQPSHGGAGPSCPSPVGRVLPGRRELLARQRGPSWPHECGRSGVTRHRGEKREGPRCRLDIRQVGPADAVMLSSSHSVWAAPSPMDKGERLPTVTWIPSRSTAPQSQEQLHPDARTLETPK